MTSSKKNFVSKPDAFILLKINTKKVYSQISSTNDFTSELHYLYLQINSVNSQFTNLPVGSFFAALSCFTLLH